MDRLTETQRAMECFMLGIPTGKETHGFAAKPKLKMLPKKLPGWFGSFAGHVVRH